MKEIQENKKLTNKTRLPGGSFRLEMLVLGTHLKANMPGKWHFFKNINAESNPMIKKIDQWFATHHLGHEYQDFRNNVGFITCLYKYYPR